MAPGLPRSLLFCQILCRGRRPKSRRRRGSPKKKWAGAKTMVKRDLRRKSGGRERKIMVWAAVRRQAASSSSTSSSTLACQKGARSALLSALLPNRQSNTSRREVLKANLPPPPARRARSFSERPYRKLSTVVPPETKRWEHFPFITVPKWMLQFTTYFLIIKDAVVISTSKGTTLLIKSNSLSSWSP